MLPELFRIPLLNLPIHTYGTLYVAGLMLGLLVVYRQSLLIKKYYNDVMDFGFWVLIGALVGARILFIIVESHYYFAEEPYTFIPLLGISIPTVLALWKGGFVFWGGAVGGIIALIIFCRHRHINAWEFADLCAPGLAIGHAVGRIVCIAGGCCYGRASYHLDQAGQVIADAPFALSFPPGSIAYGLLRHQASSETLTIMDRIGTTVPLFPVQLVESLGNIVIFFVLMMMIPIKRTHGQIALSYLILYSIMRSLTETMRGDTARGFVIDNLLSTSQFISLIISSLALLTIIFLSLKRNPNTLEN